MTHGRYAIILTHNRPELLDRCLEAIAPQVDITIIIDNASDPPADPSGMYGCVIIRDDEQPPNLSRLWNVGLKAVLMFIDFPSGPQTWDVAFLCDDAIVHPGWFSDVSTCIRNHDAVIGSTHHVTPVSQPILKTEPDHDVWNRMCPWAFIMRGERGFEADEDLKWWWGDTFMDFTGRKAGGMVIAPGPVVPNEKMGEFTNIYSHLGEQAGKDGETFAAKYGGRPW